MTPEQRDMLIRLDTKMIVMCGSLTNMNNDNKKDHKEIIELLEKKIEHIDDRLEEKVDFKWFRWLVGIVTAFMIVFGSTVIDHIKDSELCIDRNTYKIESHIKNSMDKLNYYKVLEKPIK